jgi:5-hydroxyisourate hydrolase-like protein (transthyretin family)
LLALVVVLAGLGLGDVAPAQGAPIDAVDAQAVDTGRIEGRVSGTFGEPVSGIYMEFSVHRPNGLEYVTNATTGADGSFGVQVPTGRYFIRLSGRGENRQSTTVDDVEVTALAITRVDVTMPALGVISGRITDALGLPGGFCASALRFDGHEWDHGAATCVDAVTGAYRLDELEPGRYRVRFYSQNQTHHTQWWDSASHRHDGRPVEVSLDEVVTGVDGRLARTSHLQGRVTTESGQPLQDVRVAAYDVRGGDVDEVAYASTDAAGNYDIPVRAGTFYLRFEDVYEQRHGHEWWSDARTTDEATAVTISVDGTVVPGLDGALGPPSVLEGRVTSRAGHPLGSATMTAYELVGGRWRSIVRTGTQEDGSYRFRSLGPGTYRLSVRTGDQEWFWPDEEAVEDSPDVEVPPSTTVRRDFSVAPRAGAISGTVTDTLGNPASVSVVAYTYLPNRDAWLPAASTTSVIATGTYVFDNLEPGTYRVGFAVDSRGPLATEYWDDAPTVASARDVQVRDQEVTASIDARLQLSGEIGGTVTAPPGSGVGSFDVLAWAQSRGTWSVVSTGYRVHGSSTTAYRLSGLAPGRYKVQFVSSDHPQEWWSDARTRDAGEWVQVTAGQTAGGIDAAFDAPATISGTIRVRNRTGTFPLELAAVGAYRLVDDVWVRERWVETDDTGGFEIDALPAGVYKMVASSSILGDYPPRWYGDAPDRADATELTLVAGHKVEGVDITLVPPSILWGTVTKPSGNPVEGVRVTVHLREDGGWVESGSATTDEDGLYYLMWMRPGTYRVEFDPGEEWAAEWWDDGTSLASATDVVVGESEVVDDINAELSRPRPVLRSPVQNMVRPSILGTPRVGSELTAAPGSWSPADVSYRYQWLEDGAFIHGAVERSLTLTAEREGSTISVRVTGRKTGYQSEVATSDGVGPVTQPPVAEPHVSNDVPPSISGTARVGAVVEAAPGTWTPAHATFAYQWFQNGAAISGETARKLTVPAGALGTHLSVRVTASRPGHLSGTATSGPTDAVLPGSVTTETPPSITGRPRVGRTLTLITGAYSPAGTQVTLAWFVGGIQAPQRGPTLRLRARHLKKRVWAVVYVTAPGYATLTMRTPTVRVRRRQ